MPVDHAEVLRRFKAYVAEKPHHGSRDLLAELGRLEATCGVDPSAYAQFLERFAEELGEAFLNIVPAESEGAIHEEPVPIPDAAASAPAMDAVPSPSIGRDAATKEDACPQKLPPGRAGSPPTTPSPSLALAAS